MTSLEVRKILSEVEAGDGPIKQRLKTAGRRLAEVRKGTDLPEFLDAGCEIILSRLTPSKLERLAKEELDLVVRQIRFWADLAADLVRQRKPA
jgi:hypothetical protein